MNSASIFALLQIMLPVVEEGVSFFIHKPTSQQKYNLIVGDVNSIAGSLPQLAAASATPATPAA